MIIFFSNFIRNCGKIPKFTFIDNKNLLYNISILLDCSCSVETVKIVLFAVIDANY